MNEFNNLEKKIDKLTNSCQFIKLMQQISNISLLTNCNITQEKVSNDGKLTEYSDINYQNNVNEGNIQEHEIDIYKIYKKICKYGNKYEELCSLNKIDDETMQKTTLYIKLQTMLEYVIENINI